MVDVKTKLLLLNDTFALVFMRTVYKSSPEGAVHTGEDTVYPDGHASAQYFNVVELSIAVKKSGPYKHIFLELNHARIRFCRCIC